MGFSFIDWSILAASLLLVFYVGLIGRRYVKDTSDFLVAGRRMGVHVGTISLLSTEIGMITYMYYAEMGVLYGFTAFIVGVLSGGAYYFLGTTGFVIKKFRELELVTIPQYFEQKYSRRLRVLVGILMAVGGALNFGVFPIIEAKFLNIVTGIPQDYIIWTMVLLILMVLVYTVMGGMVSVLVTNYVQYIVLATGMVIVSFLLFLHSWLGSDGRNGRESDGQVGLRSPGPPNLRLEVHFLAGSGSGGGPGRLGTDCGTGFFI